MLRISQFVNAVIFVIRNFADSPEETFVSKSYSMVHPWLVRFTVGSLTDELRKIYSSQK